MTSKFRNLIGANLVSVLKNTTEGELHNNSARRLAASLKLNNENNRKVIFLKILVGLSQASRGVQLNSLKPQNLLYPS